MSEETATSPPRCSRKWFSDIAITAWGLLIFLNIPRELLGWHPGKVASWTIILPPAVLFVASAVPWLFLTLRDARAKRADPGDLRYSLFAVFVICATAFAVRGAITLIA